MKYWDKINSKFIFFGPSGIYQSPPTWFVSSIVSPGTKFYVPTVDQLKAGGWTEHPFLPQLVPPTMTPRTYIRDPFVSQEAIIDHGGKTLTVSKHFEEGCDRYCVEEVSPTFPVETILKLGYESNGLKVDRDMVNIHTCIPGMTPIMGYIICKDCGKNIREVGK